MSKKKVPARAKPVKVWVHKAIRRQDIEAETMDGWEFVSVLWTPAIISADKPHTTITGCRLEMTCDPRDILVKKKVWR